MSEIYSYEIRIPRERVAVLIGDKGKVKRKLENETKTDIHIDSQEGVVTVAGSDAISLMDAREIIKAIARGFNPKVAFLLLKQDYSFELIDLTQFSRNKNDMGRIKGRIIGAEGRGRKTIEDLTATDITVYGKTVAIVGEISGVSMAKRALSMIIQGSPHSVAFGFLERQRKRAKAMEGWDVDQLESFSE